LDMVELRIAKSPMTHTVKKTLFHTLSDVRFMQTQLGTHLQLRVLARASAQLYAAIINKYSTHNKQFTYVGDAE